MFFVTVTSFASSNQPFCLPRVKTGDEACTSSRGASLQLPIACEPYTLSWYRQPTPAESLELICTDQRPFGKEMKLLPHPPETWDEPLTGTNVFTASVEAARLR